MCVSCGAVAAISGGPVRNRELQVVQERTQISNIGALGPVTQMRMLGDRMVGAGDGGIVILGEDLQVQRIIRSSDGLCGNSIRDMEVSDRSVWVVPNGGGLCRLTFGAGDGRELEIERWDAIGREVLAIGLLPDGTPWISVRHDGVWAVPSDGVAARPTWHSSALFEQMGDIVEIEAGANGTVWMLSEYGSVARADAESITIIADLENVTADTESSTIIWSESGKMLWVNTSGLLGMVGEGGGWVELIHSYAWGGLFETADRMVHCYTPNVLLECDVMDSKGVRTATIAPSGLEVAYSALGLTGDRFVVGGDNMVSIVSGNGEVIDDAAIELELDNNYITAIRTFPGGSMAAANRNFQERLFVRLTGEGIWRTWMVPEDLRYRAQRGRTEESAIFDVAMVGDDILAIRIDDVLVLSDDGMRRVTFREDDTAPNWVSGVACANGDVCLLAWDGSIYRFRVEADRLVGEQISPPSEGQCGDLDPGIIVAESDQQAVWHYGNCSLRRISLTGDAMIELQVDDDWIADLALVDGAAWLIGTAGRVRVFRVAGGQALTRVATLEDAGILSLEGFGEKAVGLRRGLADDSPHSIVWLELNESGDSIEIQHVVSLEQQMPQWHAIDVAVEHDTGAILVLFERGGMARVRRLAISLYMPVGHK